MSYGQKPTAWARPQGASQQQQQLNPSLFTSQLGLATAAGQPFSASIAGMPLNSAGLLVNQAAFSNMNSVLAQAQRQMQIPQQIQQQQAQRVAPTTAAQTTRSQRTFIGTVTKLMETYGFVDEDVFFQTNVIKGSMPRVGDRVMVEANFNPSMPFKWNARSIEKAQNEYRQDAAPAQHSAPQHQQYQSHQSRQIHQQQQNGTATRWGERMQRDEIVREPRRPAPAAHRSPPAARRPQSRQRSPPPSRRSPPSVRRHEPSGGGTKRERDTRNEVEHRERDQRDTSARARSPQSKRDTASPPRRRQRTIPRYHCNVPKLSLCTGELQYNDLRKRYGNLYIPSDFIRCKFDWIDSIKLETPPKFSPHPINFHVLNKDIDVPLEDGVQLPPENPSDADNHYVVKVLLFSHSGVSALRRKLAGLLPDGSIDESTETQPLTKNIQLLVGYRGKGEIMCIGGAWSPSLDGENPLDPQTVVKTAIRTTHALTGINLSSCAKWYKMLHLHYFRPERSRVDSCILLMPDTSTVPEFRLTEEQYRQTEQALQAQLKTKLSAIEAEEFVPPNLENAKNLGTVVDGDGTAAAAADTAMETETDGGGKQQKKPTETQTSSDAPSEKTTETAAAAEEENVTSEHSLKESGATTTKKGGKSHWSFLEQNIKAMKVAELREELEARQLEPKGVKNVLMQRLQEAIEKEKVGDKETNTTGSEKPAEKENEQNVAEKAEEKKKKEKESIVVQIKEEIIELMETDEVGEKTDEGDKKDGEKEAKEKEELEKSKEKFEKEKKEKKATLERHYLQIPKNEPKIFVYPSKSAKSGKFDCKLMSLHSLLEYNKEHDNKEASFEVFLFAEALKESFDRSSAFTVYHTIATARDKDEEKKCRNAALSEACKDEDVVVVNDGSSKKEEKDEKSKSPSGNVDLRTNFKALINDPEVFMAFSHFDSNICGYIIDKDLEDIIHSTGIDLSRFDVQQMLKKISSKERVNYRTFTDKFVDKEGNVKYAPAPTYENLFQSYVEHAKSRKSLIGAETGCDFSQNSGAYPKAANSSGIVNYHGEIFNIKQSIENQSAMEKERQTVMDKNEQLELQLDALKEQRDYLEKKKKRLEEDVDRNKKKLHETEKQLKKEQEDSATMKAAFLDCKRYGERVIGVVEKIFPSPKKEEKEKGAKENNKEATKEKDDEVMVVEDGKGGEGKGSVVDKLLAKFENSKKNKDDEEKREKRAGSI